MKLTIKLTKAKLALVVAVVALAGTSVAYATHSFSDVEDDKWYTDAVAWAYDNGITTGKTPTTFNGDDGVTRYEAVTFQQRYEENVAAPARTVLADDISDNADAISANAVAISGNASDHDQQVGRVAYEQFEDENDWDGNDLRTDVTVDVPTDGFLIVNYSANIGRDINESGSGTITVTAEFEHDAVTIDTYFQVIDLDAGLFDFDTHTLSFTHVLEAVAGDNDVDVTLSHGGGAGDLLYVYNENLNVLFVPFDANNEPIIVPLGVGDDGRNHSPDGNI